MGRLMSYKRPNWDEYFMEIVQAIAKRGTCDRGRSGAVIVKNKQLISAGYVGSPMGMPHCDEVGHQIKKTVHEDGTVTEHCVRTVHAEQNAICQAAKNGVSINGSTLYISMTPCRACAMMIVNAGIKRVVCMKKYKLAFETERIFKKAGVKLEYFSDDVMCYPSSQ
jgi:dCMP deaminase